MKKREITAQTKDGSFKTSLMESNSAPSHWGQKSLNYPSYQHVNKPDLLTPVDAAALVYCSQNIWFVNGAIKEKVHNKKKKKQTQSL